MKFVNAQNNPKITQKCNCVYMDAENFIKMKHSGGNEICSETSFGDKFNNHLTPPSNNDDSSSNVQITVKGHLY